MALSQIQAVEIAMEESGGYATLAQLYREALRVEGANWSGTKTPFASIRRIVQTSGRFWKIRPGLWALNSHRKRLCALFGAKELALDFDAPSEFNHGYYQGLLLELGRFEGFQTSVPAQDKNRRFLEKPLHELATLSEIPAFTFDRLLHHARTIDAAWYNARLFPHAFFEVEHSTDIQNSLLKFLEFQDYRTQFFIVADAARHAEWQDKMQRQAFVELRERVRFLTYEQLAKRHSSASEAFATRL